MRLCPKISILVFATVRLMSASLQADKGTWTMEDAYFKVVEGLFTWDAVIPTNGGVIDYSSY